ncbi:MAG TPA: type I restriction enzyme endonuclease domain-containing protein [Bryobacteraceae bacterium]
MSYEKLDFVQNRYSNEILARLAALPQRNLALETLRKLLNDQIRTRKRVNIVQSRSFRQ